MCSELYYAFDCKGTITFDWNKLKKADFTRLCMAITQWFCTTTNGPVKALLTLLDNCDGIPKAPTIGYMGKKHLQVLVPTAKAEQYKTDLIAAAHMVDVDLTSATNICVCDRWTKYQWIYVSGYYVAQHGAEKPKRNRWGRAVGGEHLKPATSKLANLIRLWQEELFPERKPLLDWVKEKHTLTFSLSTD